MRSRIMLVVLVALLAVGSTPVVAQAADDSVCVDIPSAGYTDVDPASVHKPDIDCLKYWDITTQEGTFDPKGLVSRWQMALFMVRTFEWDFYLPTGDSQGFTDIAGLPADQQLAINQVRQLGITAGTSPTTYDPNGTVTRWQMALFLTRLISAAGVVLPDGSAQGFTDIGALPAPTQVAINQMRQLGITSGTSPTTYGPNDPVTREQMASFLIRTFKKTTAFYLQALLEFFTPGGLTCTPPLTVPPAPGTVCTGSVTTPSRVLPLRGLWVADLPFATAADQQAFLSSGFRIEFWVDGSQVPVVEKVVTLPGIINKIYYFELSALTGTHTVEERVYDNGVLLKTIRGSLTFS